MVPCVYRLLLCEHQIEVSNWASNWKNRCFVYEKKRYATHNYVSIGKFSLKFGLSWTMLNSCLLPSIHHVSFHENQAVFLLQTGDVRPTVLSGFPILTLVSVYSTVPLPPRYFRSHCAFLASVRKPLIGFCFHGHQFKHVNFLLDLRHTRDRVMSMYNERAIGSNALYE